MAIILNYGPQSSKERVSHVRLLLLNVIKLRGLTRKKSVSGQWSSNQLDGHRHSVMT